jgi:hypothetical protein
MPPWPWAWGEAVRGVRKIADVSNTSHTFTKNMETLSGRGRMCGDGNEIFGLPRKDPRILFDGQAFMQMKMWGSRSVQNCNIKVPRRNLAFLERMNKALVIHYPTHLRLPQCYLAECAGNRTMSDPPCALTNVSSLVPTPPRKYAAFCRGMRLWAPR